VTTTQRHELAVSARRPVLIVDRWLVGLGLFFVFYIGMAQAIMMAMPHRAVRADEWFSVWMRLLPWLLVPITLVAILQALLTARAPDGRLSPLHHGWAAVRAGPLSPRTLLRVALVCIVLPAFHRSFTVYKSSMTKVVDFWADPWLMWLDRVLHGGVLPHEWLGPLLGSPQALLFLSDAYWYWHLAMLTGILLVAFSQDDAYRRRATIAFLATWVVLGNVMALLLSSAGPWWYDRVTGELSPYEGLVGRLWEVGRHTPLRAVGFQQQLWLMHASKKIGLGTGISAMPSLHVAIPVLGFLIAREKSRLLTACCAVFGTTIFLGSIALAWHYAVDGYVSAVAVCVIWAVAGKFTTSNRSRLGSV
jgi:hypothetical protein